MNKIRRGLWPEAWAVASLVALTLAFFWKIAFTNRILAGLDVFAYFYPYRHYVSEALRSGHLPLWNPYLFMGVPLLANSQAAVLYPLHWPLVWLSTPKQVAWSIVFHVMLAGTGTYVFCRRAFRLSRPAAWAGAVVFALSGFLGAQVEHLNQLNASAWLPWLLLCLKPNAARDRRRPLALLGGGLVVGLSLLAGHLQASYIVVSGGLVYSALNGCRPLTQRRRAQWMGCLTGLTALVAVVLMGLLLAAGQLLPTLELSRLSVRSGGLPYNEAASFSLKPDLVFRAFLPPFVWEPPYSEYIAYVGLVAMFLAGAGIWSTGRRLLLAARARESTGSDRQVAWHAYHTLVIIVLAALGVFLAFGAYNPVYYILYKIVPGFSLFRAPARWLLLYSFGMAVLCGVGLDSLRGLATGWRRAAVCLLVVELFLVSRSLAYNKPTAPAAFDSLRTAPAHLLADEARTPFRFLSMSDIQFDPGDMGDLQGAYGADLPSESVYDLIVATKMKEVLAYNLPLRYRLYSVDGYDGGLLPTASYVNLERLFLPEEQIWSDGRLRQQLSDIPPNQLLSLLNVRYVITDKLQDVWIDDVYYDLQHTVSLGAVTLDDLPAFETTHLGIVSYLQGANHVRDQTPVAEITVTASDGAMSSLLLRAGIDTAEGRFENAAVSHRKARVGHQRVPSAEAAGGDDYISVLELGQAIVPKRIVLRSLLPGDQGQTVELRGLSLIDRRSAASRNLSVDPSYRLVHSGDVKVYENLRVLPRAFVVSEVAIVSDDDAALALMAAPGFDPSQQVILSQGTGGPAEPGPASVDLLLYRPERVELSVTVGSPAYVVLTDAFYPGWRAEIDGQPADVQRADLYFRSVAVAEGTHRLALFYDPASVRLGLVLSVGSAVAWILAAGIVVRRIGRAEPSVV